MIVIKTGTLVKLNSELVVGSAFLSQNDSELFSAEERFTILTDDNYYLVTDNKFIDEITGEYSSVKLLDPVRLTSWWVLTSNVSEV